MQPGDHVILVNDDWSTSKDWRIRDGQIERPVRGTVYTITHACMVAEKLHIELFELPEYNVGRARWSAWRFRKLSRLTPESILAIETTDPIPVHQSRSF